MKYVSFIRTGIIGVISSATVLGGTGAALAAPIQPGDLGSVPGRTAITFADSNTGFSIGTANQHESRAGLSTVKLYMADYVLRHGDGSAADGTEAERMVRGSDDAAASRLYAKYPDSINGPAHEYGLGNTHGAGHWGDSTTSTTDTVKFLEAKKQTDPGSPVLGWMRTAHPVAADGTHQNWGTATLLGAEGSKWGWSDDRVSQVNSATIGNGYSVAAATNGDAAAQTADVQGAFIPALFPNVPTLEDLERMADETVADLLGQWEHSLQGWPTD